MSTELLETCRGLKHSMGEIVRQIGHLPELYEDARSEKYKILYHSVSLYKLRDIVLNSEMTAFLKSPIS